MDHSGDHRTTEREGEKERETERQLRQASGAGGGTVTVRVRVEGTCAENDLNYSDTSGPMKRDAAGETQLAHREGNTAGTEDVWRGGEK